MRRCEKQSPDNKHVTDQGLRRFSFLTVFIVEGFHLYTNFKAQISLSFKCEIALYCIQISLLLTIYPALYQYYMPCPVLYTYDFIYPYNKLFRSGFADEK